jgi:uncharacterized membrane protein YqgA involved in biofilm formation
MCDLPLIGSMIIFGFGIIFSIIPVLVYRKINASTIEELKDKQMLLNYYTTIGITIMIIGFLLILIFSNKLVLPNF